MCSALEAAAAALLSTGSSPSTAIPAWRDPRRAVADRVSALMAAMTIEEKVAQLGSAWEDVEPAGPEVAPGTSLLGVVGPLQETARHGIGQLTRPYGTVPRPALEHAGILAARHRQVLTYSRLGIPAMTHDECLTGVTAFGATIYPTPLGMAATFDPALIGRVGRAIGADLAEAGVHQGLSPVLDVIRDQRWGRCEETFGEDPFLVGEMAEAYVLGLQNDGVIATLKHFAGYSASGGGRNHAPVHIGRRELYDVILPPFERVVAAGVGSVMNSYADIDGEAPAASTWLLTTVLRDQWGFAGTVVSDYWSIPFLVSAHRVSTDWQGAGAAALAAGIDVELPDQRGFGHRLVELVNSGAVDEQLVDRAVRRVLTQKVQLGLLDPNWNPESRGLQAGQLNLDKPTSRALARETALGGAVLVRNEGVLPLAQSVLQVAVIGPCADEARVMFGCYSFPNHVLSDRPELGIGVTAATYRQSLATARPEVKWLYSPGCPIREADFSGIDQAVQAARTAELAVVIVGDQPGMFGIGTSGEGCDVEDLRLPGVQEDLVTAVLDTGTPTVVVINSGRPYSVGAFDRAAALVQVFLPGEEGGPALADLLTGHNNFSGKLPVQIPANPFGQPHTYLHAPLAGRRSELSNLDPTPAYPFGHGLSYTSFTVENLQVSTMNVGCDEQVSVTVDVTNTGARAGREVVQLYFTDPVAQVARPVRQLLGFAKVDLEPGETVSVTFDVHTDRFAFAGANHRPGAELIVEPGTITLLAGSSSEDLPQALDLELTGPARVMTSRTTHQVPFTVHRHPLC